jgi:catechol 2,3-dioxygenase-like lactoylglutathione lyase family enzyme
MLSSEKIIAFLATSDPARALAFYAGKLGLRLVKEEQPFALVFDCDGTMLRLQIVREKIAPAPYTAFGWEVGDIEAQVRDLERAGVVFERFPNFMQQDELGIWAAPSGAKVAWFKDPDGNLLSLTQFSKRS